MLKIENAGTFFPCNIFIVCTKPYYLKVILYAISWLPYLYVVV